MVFETTPGYNVDEYIGFCKPLDDIMKSQYQQAATFGDTRIHLHDDRQ